MISRCERERGRDEDEREETGGELWERGTTRDDARDEDARRTRRERTAEDDEARTRDRDGSDREVERAREREGVERGRGGD